jgi:hypothetical protein
MWSLMRNSTSCSSNNKLINVKIEGDRLFISWLYTLSKYKYDRLVIVKPLIPYIIPFSLCMIIELGFDTINYSVLEIISFSFEGCSFYEIFSLIIPKSLW